MLSDPGGRGALVGRGQDCGQAQQGAPGAGEPSDPRRPDAALARPRSRAHGGGTAAGAGGGRHLAARAREGRCRPVRVQRSRRAQACGTGSGRVQGVRGAGPSGPAHAVTTCIHTPIATRSVRPRPKRMCRSTSCRAIWGTPHRRPRHFTTRPALAGVSTRSPSCSRNRWGWPTQEKNTAVPCEQGCWHWSLALS